MGNCSLGFLDFSKSGDKKDPKNDSKGTTANERDQNKILIVQEQRFNRNEGSDDNSQPNSDPELTYQQSSQPIHKKFNSSSSLPSTLQSSKIKKKKLSKQDFRWISKIGSGTYGEVFLVLKANDSEKKKYAMKILKKSNILDRKLEAYTQLEQQILKQNKNKFLVDLKYSFQSRTKVYFLMEYLEGGDLYKLLKQVKRFNVEQTRFIVAQVILGLKYMHETLYIKYRDLKPENILLSKDGYVKLTDFGLAKYFKDKQELSKTFVGTLEYQAPEIIMGRGNTKEVDLWGIGILIFELLEGTPPFTHPNRNQHKIREQIRQNSPKFPIYFTKITTDLIQKLLVTDPSQRLGAKSFDDIIQHPFFNGFNWKGLIAGTLESPIKVLVAQNMHAIRLSNTTRELCDTPEANNLKNFDIPDISYNQDDSLNKPLFAEVKV